MSDASRLVSAGSRPQRAVHMGQRVEAWRISAGCFVPVELGTAPAADLTPVASGPPIPVPPYDERLTPAAELRPAKRPSWWRTWLESVAQHPAGHVGALVGLGLICTSLLMAGGLL